MRNIVGRPVRGTNFFDRDEIRAQILEWLRDNHLLLLAPRRVGKTSLMYRLAVEALERKHVPVYFSAATARSELALLVALYKAAAEADADVALAFEAGRLGRLFKQVGYVKAFGVELALRELQAEEWTDVGNELIQAIRATGRSWLFLLD